MQEVFIDREKELADKSQLIEKLVLKCGLGNIIADVESVSGGLKHRLYRVTTSQGIYAVKHLNAEIMKRPNVFDNYARAEKLEEMLEQNEIPIVPALIFHGKKMQSIDGEYFYVFRWQNGSITDWENISKEQCYLAGNILGKIHAIAPKNVKSLELELNQIVCKSTCVLFCKAKRYGRLFVTGNEIHR